MYYNTDLIFCQEREKKMDDPEARALKAQLSRRVDGMNDYQVRLVLSFVTTLFGSEPAPAKEQEGTLEIDKN